MSVSIDTFGANFVHYLGGVIKVLNKTVRAKELCKGGTKKWEGSKLVKHVHVERSAAFNLTEDGGAIPPAKKQGYVEASAYRKFAYGSVGITDGQLNNATTTKHAAIKVVDSELRGLMEGMALFYNLFWTRDGTGVVTLLGATTNGSTITVDDARAIWRKGTYTCLDASTPTTEHFNFECDSVARSYNNTLYSATVTPTASVASGSQAADDLIVWGAGAYQSYNKAITGLDAGIDDAATTFQGVDCATYTQWTSPVLSNSGTRRDLTPALIRRMLSSLKQEGGQAKKTMSVLSTVWICEKFDEMYESAVRITPDDTTVGQATPTFQSSHGKVRIESDQHSPYGKMFFLEPSEITFAVQKELHWRPVSNGGGGIFMRSDVSGKYTATCMEQSEIFYEARNRCGKIEDISETVGTAF